MYTLATFNAVGTVYRCYGVFDTIEQAEEYWSRWHHTGLGSYPFIIRRDDEQKLRAINNEWSNDARQMMQVSAGRLARLEREWQEFLGRTQDFIDRHIGQYQHDCHMVA